MEETSITLPLDQKNFRDFISAILGKPQTLTSVIFVSFEIKQEDLLNIFNLIDQRVNQQNRANLIQFSTKVIYSDNSTRLLSSYDELNTYTEPRDVIPIAVHLQISYLIRFNDSKSPDGFGKPEKQEIEISIVTSKIRRYRAVNFESINLFPFETDGHFEIIIKHTAITWGSDIESILTKHLKTLLKDESKIKTFIKAHSGGIGLGIGTLFFIVCIIFSILNTEKVNTAQLEKIKAVVIENESISIESLNKKINFIIENGLSTLGNTQSLIVSLFLILSFIISIVLAIWVGMSADTSSPSFLLLTRSAEKNKQKQDKKEKKQWRSFMLSIIISVLTGVLSNYIFTYLCTKIINP
jgi:hypothetical protein